MTSKGPFQTKLFWDSMKGWVVMDSIFWLSEKKKSYKNPNIMADTEYKI